MTQQEQRPTVSDAIRKHKEFLFPAVAMYYKEPIALVKGEGEHVWDDAGNKYLDCFGGVLTVNTPPKQSRYLLPASSHTCSPSPFTRATGSL